MRIGSIFNLFASKDLREKTTPLSQVADDTAFAFPSIVSGFDWPTYNPDELIGRQGHRVYERMMTDEQVKAVVRFRRDAVTGRSWRFDPPKIEDEEEARRRVALFEEIVSVYPGTFKTDMDKVALSMQQGVSITEKTFANFESELDGKEWVGIQHLRKKPWYTFYFYVDDYGNLIRMTQQVDGRDIDLDPRKFVIHVKNPDVDEFYGRSELREAYRAWYSKDVTIKFHNLFMERLAGGFIVAKPQGDKRILAGTKEYNDLLAALSNAKSSSAILLPSDVEVELLFPPTTDAYEKAIAIHDKAIAKAMLTPNLLGISEQGNTGSYSQSQTQLEAFLWMLDTEAASLEETLNEQLFKHLGQLNFPDGRAPVFRLEPLSDQQRLEIVKIWKELVAGQVVLSTDEDEDTIRSMLDMPERARDEEEEQTEPTKPAMTGIQLQGLKDILAAVGSGEMDPVSAVITLIEGFGMSSDRAQEIVDSIVASVEERKKDEPASPPPPGQEGAEEEEREDTDPDVENISDDKKEDPDGDDETMRKDEDKKGTGAYDETVKGRRLAIINSAAFKRAEKRVDFATIERDLSSISAVAVRRAAPALMKLALSAVDQINEQTLETPDVSQIRIAPDPKAASALRKRLTAALVEAWEMGTRESRNELNKALGAERYSALKPARFARIEADAAQRYLSTRAYTMTGGFSDSIVGVVRNQILNGIRYARGTTEVVDAVFEQLVSKGIVTLNQMTEIAETRGLNKTLEKLTGIKNAQHRLETVIRTSTAEAMNEARNSFFSDPDLSGVVVAYEYSSILDDSTTEICNELEGHTHSIDWAGWDSYRPPNHYNCRSLLVPITRDEEWEESDEPSVQPQEGFG